ncbi:MAG: energy-coupling factor transporter transmembrane component T [Scrofimicrobium sp.]
MSSARVSTRPVTSKSPLMHPLVLVLFPIPAMVAILFGDKIEFSLVALVIGLIAAAFRGWRSFRTALVTTLSTLLILWIGFSISLPADPFGVVSPPIAWLPFHPTEANIYYALRGAMRIVVVLLLYVLTVAYVDWRAFSDTLIDRFHVPYRVMDVLGLGGRFAVLIRRDVMAAWSLAKLRARGDPLRSIALSSRLTIPVLMASFNHADELSITMDARGFGALPRRTVHHSFPVRPRDVLALVVVWATTIALALLLAR